MHADIAQATAQMQNDTKDLRTKVNAKKMPAELMTCGSGIAQENSLSTPSGPLSYDLDMNHTETQLWPQMSNILQVLQALYVTSVTVKLASEMHFNAFQRIAQLNTTLA